MYANLFDLILKDSATLGVAQYKYTNWNNLNDTSANLANIDLFYGDSFFFCPLVQFAEFYTQAKQSVYQYYFTQRNTLFLWPSWAGVLHTDDLNFVFGAPIPSISGNSASERVLSRKMIKYWSNFARFQNPNGNGTALSINTGTMNQSIENWPLYTLPESSSDALTRSYVNLNAAGVVGGYNWRVDYCSLWNTLIPTLKSQSKTLVLHFFTLYLENILNGIHIYYLRLDSTQYAGQSNAKSSGQKSAYCFSATITLVLATFSLFGY